MLLNLLRKATDYTMEVNVMGLLAILSNPDLLFIFFYTPLYLVMLPLMGALSNLLALIHGYKLLTAKNRNFDQWFTFIASVVSSALISAALYGSVAATMAGSVFMMTPLLLNAGMVVMGVYQFVMAGVHLYRAFHANSDSVENMHHIQSFGHHAFKFILTAAVASCVATVLFMPFSPVIAPLAFLAVALIGLDIGWKILPPSWKSFIKQELGFAKPNVHNSVRPEEERQPTSAIRVEANEAVKSSIFSRHLFLSSKCTGQLEQQHTLKDGVTCLVNIIQGKLKRYAQLEHPNEKIKQKQSLLRDLIRDIKADKFSLDKTTLSEHYPSAFQSFWMEKGETEQIVDAYLDLGKQVKSVPIQAYCP